MDIKGTWGRTVATIVIWLGVIGAIALISLGLAPIIGSDALGAIFMVLVAAVVSNGFIWNWGRGAGLSRHQQRKRREMIEDVYDMALSKMQKRKREDIGSRLSDFSDAELMDLRDRIQAGEIDEDELAYLLRQ